MARGGTRRRKDFNPYLSGGIVYGYGRSGPNTGMKLNPTGYRERDLKAKTRNAAARRMLKAKASGNPNSPDVLRGPRG